MEMWEPDPECLSLKLERCQPAVLAQAYTRRLGSSGTLTW